MLPALARENDQVISGWRLHYFPDAGERFEALLTDSSDFRQESRKTFAILPVGCSRAHASG